MRLRNGWLVITSGMFYQGRRTPWLRVGLYSLVLAPWLRELLEMLARGPIVH